MESFLIIIYGRLLASWFLLILVFKVISVYIPRDTE